MPHDVTMPQLGMAQDAGRIVAWLKAPGDAVARGDALFEVETDKATMEVEAQADGFLTAVSAGEGDDVPVGRVIARISESAEAETEVPAQDRDGIGADPGGLPEGTAVTMPQLGMAQDSGLLVAWQKAPGEPVAVDDVLFEVETDKSTMEVPAGVGGYLAATLAEAGEEVPVGDPVAIISAEKPADPMARSAAQAAATPKLTPAAPTTAPGPAPIAPEPTPPRPAPRAGGRILASPKARRLALEEGLDLARLAEAGHPQPFHVRDLDALRALPGTAPAATQADAARRLVADIAADGLQSFAAWAETRGLTDPDAILAGLAGAGLPAPGAVAIERHGAHVTYAVPAGRALSTVAPTDAVPVLILRDLRGARLSAVAMGAEDTPVLTLTSTGAGLTITLECAPAHLDAQAALRLLTEFAGRMEQPLRHLL